MSEEIIGVVSRGMDAFNRRELAAALALWSPDGELDWSRSNGPLKGVYRGHRELEAFWNEFWSTFETVELEMHAVEQIGGSQVIVPNTAHMLGRDGIEVIAKSAFLFTVEDGLTIRLEMFQEEAEALEATRLRE